MQVVEKVYKGQVVGVESRYNGMMLFVADEDSDQYGDFMASDQDGDSQLINVDDVSHIAK